MIFDIFERKLIIKSKNIVSKGTDLLLIIKRSIGKHIYHSEKNADRLNDNSFNVGKLIYKFDPHNTTTKTFDKRFVKKI